MLLSLISFDVSKEFRLALYLSLPKRLTCAASAFAIFDLAVSYWYLPDVVEFTKTEVGC